MRRKSFAVIASVLVPGLTACDNPADPDPGTPVDISYAACVNSASTPSWFAYQDGEGTWTRVTPSAAGAFNFTLTQGRGGIATFNAEEGLFIRYASTDEFKANVPACAGPVRTVTGSVAGYATLDNTTLQMGTASGSVQGIATPPASYQIPAVDATATDLFARRYRTVAGTTTFEEIPDRIALRRGVTGSTAPPIDFASATGVVTPGKRTLNVTNIAVNERLTVFSTVAMSTTLGITSYFQNAISFVSGSIAAPFYGVASSALTTGESQMLVAVAERTESSSASASRFGSMVFSDAADKAITLGPSLGPVTVTGSSRPSAAYTVQSGYDNHFDVVFTQGNGASFRQARVLGTRAYLGGASQVKLSVPNLSGVNGFQSSWLLAPGVSSTWSFTATNADISVLNNRPFAYLGAERSSTFTP